MNSFNEIHQKAVSTLQEELGVKNRLAIPRMTKIVLNVGVKDAAQNKSVLEHVVADLIVITGQKPKTNRAKKSIAAFKLRQGDPIGVSCTLRGKRMQDFFQKFVSIVLPRVRDFRGVSATSFDGQGNYTIGISEQIVFPEIDYTKIDKVRGLEVTIVTSAKDDKIARRFLELLGVPFVKNSKTNI